MRLKGARHSALTQGLRILCAAGLCLAGTATDLLAGPVPRTKPPVDQASVSDGGTLERRALTVPRGGTLMDMLGKAAVPRNDAADAMAALRKLYNPRSLQAGQTLTVLFEPARGNGARRFAGLEFDPEPARRIVVRRTAKGYVTSEVKRELRSERVAAEGVIRSSLFEAGQSARVPVSVMLSLIKTYAHEVDFQRDLQPGDRFAVLYEKLETEDGKPAGEGDVLFALLTVDGKEMPIYRYRDRNGRTDYYNREGESIRRALLRTPIDGARITSGFGMRNHPILGYSKMHQGMDFGAPTGTPIYAAGNGTVEEVGGKGGYGNYIRLRHNSEIATAYAHMSRFAKGMKRGVRVEQGEVIGYVGSTGRSTGPHLHYEVLRNNRQVDPRSIDLPTGEKLEGRELQAFQQTVRGVDKLFQDNRAGLQLARGNGAGEDRGCTRAAAC